MIIEKHIIVKEIGSLTYSNVSPVYKKKSGFYLDSEGYCAEDILFNPTVSVSWKYSEISIMEEVAVVKKVELEYDFGMVHEFFPEQIIIKSPDYWEYRNIGLNSPISDIISRYVEDQLIFSMHRNPCELLTVHWALRGWLRDRTTLPWKKQTKNYE